jgi:AAHS family benzoate transporter-like MFS transporter
LTSPDSTASTARFWLGGILAPIIIGVIVALELPLEQNFLAIGLAGLLGMIAVALVNQRLAASATQAATAAA